MKVSVPFTACNSFSSHTELIFLLSVLLINLEIKLLMKRIDKNLRGAIPMVDFLNYFNAKIKKF